MFYLGESGGAVLTKTPNTNKHDDPDVIIGVLTISQLDEAARSGGFRIIDEMFGKLIHYAQTGKANKFNSDIEIKDRKNKILGFKWSESENGWINKFGFKNSAHTEIDDIITNHYDNQIPSIGNNKGIVTVYTVILVSIAQIYVCHLKQNWFKNQHQIHHIWILNLIKQFMML